MTQRATPPTVTDTTANDKQQDKDLFVEHAGAHQTLGMGKTSDAPHDSVGIALIEQKNIIPSTGERVPTSKWEYWTFCVFCGSSFGHLTLRLSLIGTPTPQASAPWETVCSAILDRDVGLTAMGCVQG